MSFISELKKFNPGPYARLIISITIAGFITAVFNYYNIESLWDVFGISWAITLSLLDIFLVNQTNNEKKNVLIDVCKLYIKLLTKRSLLSPANVEINIEILENFEILIFEICEYCSVRGRKKYEQPKGYIADYKVAFQKHLLNPINIVNYDDFIQDMSKTNIVLLQR